MKRLSRIYFTKILGYAVMGNHFHLLVTMLPQQNFSDEDIRARFLLCYGEGAEFPEGRIAHYRWKWANLSELVRELKQTFPRYYNHEKKRRGTLWGERFKSVIVEKGRRPLIMPLSKRKSQKKGSTKKGVKSPFDLFEKKKRKRGQVSV